MPGKRKSSDVLPAPAKCARPSLPTGPGGPMEIVFSFDTTGSMSSCLFKVRKNLTDTINRLQKDIPGLRMAVFAHGDYCDKRTYVTKYVDFTNDVTELVDFVNNVSATGGGDADECYELVLHQVRTKLSWSPGTQRSLVMIGDANPHQPDYPQNKLKLDWKKETENLAAEEVHIYGVNCGNSYCADFYATLAKKTDGKYLELKDWNNIFDMMMAICYREHGAELFKAYEHEVRSRSHVVSHEMDAMLKTLRRSDDDGPESDGEATAISTTVTSSTPTRTVPTKKLRSSTRKPTASKPAMRPKPASSKFVVKKAPRSLKKDSFLPQDCTRWQRFMTKRRPTNRFAKNWIPRRSGVAGFRRIGLFRGETDKPAFYEVGVKLPESRKIHPVFFRVTRGFQSGCHIDTCLFQQDHLISQINDVIKNNCDVYIKRAALPVTVPTDAKVLRLSDARDVRDYVRKNVDYPWNKGAYGRRRHRSLQKKGINISSDKF